MLATGASVGLSAGLLILRLVVGGLLFGHGAQKLFGWFGGHGPEGTGRYMQSLGYADGEKAAILAGLGESGGGALLAVGSLTPVAAAAIVGVMANAVVRVHLDKGLWNVNGGFELPLVYSSAALALAVTGPGAYSLDALAGWPLSGVGFGILALALGLAAATLALSWKPASHGPDRSPRPQAA